MPATMSISGHKRRTAMICRMPMLFIMRMRPMCTRATPGRLGGRATTADAMGGGSVGYDSGAATGLLIEMLLSGNLRGGGAPATAITLLYETVRAPVRKLLGDGGRRGGRRRRRRL